MSEDDQFIDDDELEARFEQGITDDPFAERDEGLLRDAIRIFVNNVLSWERKTAFDKAALVVAMHLVLGPDNPKDPRVHFPYIFDNLPIESASEKARKAIAREVRGLVKNGEKVTHAIAAVAAKHHKSAQKVTKDYYDWNDYWDRHDRALEVFTRKIDRGNIH
ncbi:hypothetical protein [Bordetella genomosp. 9]|uniref:Uncharacterized protein n=1 Tax=Bordetella genomosp. 9 TaxID=1416803 RepID=A0A1W6YXG9_9BORD|nr:hypothetical protein [Bordetella genomosp. 9]ARP85780.1 hypothetical protein CAL13_05830 [Bordetella genomosp. 9]